MYRIVRMEVTSSTVTILEFVGLIISSAMTWHASTPGEGVMDTRIVPEVRNFSCKIIDYDSLIYLQFEFIGEDEENCLDYPCANWQIKCVR